MILDNKMELLWVKKGKLSSLMWQFDNKFVEFATKIKHFITKA
jgi:hypothetical protein